MKLKGLITGSLLAAMPMTMLAQEDVLQIRPDGLTLNASNATLGRLMIEMNNSAAYTALQFKVVLPEGIELANTAQPFSSLSASRFPSTTVTDDWTGETTTTYDHTVEFGREMVSFAIDSGTKLSEIMGNSGAILQLYVELDENIVDGLYPIIFRDVAFSTADGVTAVRIKETSSYVVVGTPELKGAVDLSALKGYLPKDVADATTTLLAAETDVTGIDLSGIDEAGATVSSAANPNMLVYAKAGSAFAAAQAAATNNVVEGEVCNNLVLADGYPFAASKAFTAGTASYSRTVPAAGWYSLCLPFAAETPDGVAVERYVSKDVTNKTVTFNSGVIEADKPCIFKTEATDVTFSGSDVAVAVTGSNLADGDFIGTYSKNTALEGCYGLKPDGSGFGIATASAYADPFRAYINTSEVPAAAFSIVHGGDDGTTGITSVDTETSNGSKVYYNLAGQRVAQPGKGVYIVDGKAVVIK